MKRFKTILKVCLSIFISLSSYYNSYAQYDSIPFGSDHRTYLLHLPQGYTGESPIPMVLALHGGFGNAYNIENQSQLSLKANMENFIVLYPEGIKGEVLNISSWNAGWCCGYASSSGSDDVGFINSLIDSIKLDYNIDTNRIYATGMSNGGFMCYRLACELSNKIAAIAPVAASMSVYECEPIRAVPIISFHSHLDSNVPYYGGIGNGFSNHYNTPQDSVFNIWAIKNSCSPLTDTVINNSEYTFISALNCDCKSEIHHYATEDGGHSWPGGVQTQIGDDPSSYINATDLMWEFFQNHSLLCDSLSIIKPTINHENNINIFPNPSNGIFEIQTDNHYSEINILVFDILGEKVFSSKNNNVININHLKNGCYFLRITIDGMRINKKFIKKK